MAMGGYVGLLFGLMSMSVPALAWVKDYQTSYLLGDNDSRLSAKQQAMIQVQLQAMQEAGTYIQGQTQLHNEQLEERINQVSAAIVKVEVLAENFELTPQGQQTLRLSARATVDESILQERVRALRLDAQKVQHIEQLSQDNQQMRQQLQYMEQQKLALENQLLRQKLSQLQQPAVTNQMKSAQMQPHKVFPVVMNVSKNSAVQDNTNDGQNQLTYIINALQQTPIRVHINSNQSAIQIQPNWKLSLQPDSPIAALCRRWQCRLGYAYKQHFDDALASPLHLELFRPLSRIVHIDDKYISHWQLLSLQVYPPTDLTSQEKQVMQSTKLMVRVSIGQEKIELPLMYYDAEQDSLIVSLQGAVSQQPLTRYDYQTRIGDVVCAISNNSAKSCVSNSLMQFSWRTVSTPVTQGVAIKTAIIQLN